MPDLQYFITTIAPNGFTLSGGKPWLRISVCLDIDIQVLAMTDQETPAQYATRFNGFYTAFEGIHTTFAPQNLKIHLPGFPDPRTRVIHGYNANVSYDEKKGADLQSKLFKALFSSEVIDESGQTTGKKKPISQISPVSKHHQPAGFKSLHHQLTNLNDPAGKNSGQLKSFLTKANSLSQTRKKLARLANDRYHLEVHTLLNTDSSFRPLLRGLHNQGVDKLQEATNAAAFLNAKDRNILLYQSQYIDPQEFINTFTLINKNIELKRLLGFIIDLEVELPGTLEILSGKSFKFNADIGNTQWCNLTSEIMLMPVLIGKLAKYFFLLTNPNPHFQKTILKGAEQMVDVDAQNNPILNSSGNPVMVDCVELLSFDKVGQDEKIKAQKEKDARAEIVNDSEKADSFTRGIILNHRLLNTIIEAKDYDRVPGQLTIIAQNTLVEDHFVHGHRVAVLKTGEKELLSITTRSIDIRLNNDEHAILTCPSAEGSIHFDAVMHQSNDDGSTDYHSSDAMFEWNGQQLSLKSAFSKSTKVSKVEQAASEVDNPDEDNLKPSQLKCDQHLSIDTFPFKKTPSTAGVQIKYGLPDKKYGIIPKLLFGSEYRFFVYHEYKNGWALPLYTPSDNELQASLSDILNSQESASLLTKPTTFNPLENKKPVLLYLTRPVNKEVKVVDLTDKDALEHLVIRSQSTADTPTMTTQRHVLPERISLEHAFWYGLLFDMPKTETLKWKRKYNCQFTSEEEWKKAGKCSEGCGNFCGNTVMAEFYPPPHMYPNHLSDPSIHGFRITLFWDSEYKQAISSQDSTIEYIFGGTPGLSPKSYLLRLGAGVNNFLIHNEKDFESVKIDIKKGATIYAELTNVIADFAEIHLANPWWTQNGNKYQFHVPAKYSTEESRMPPKQLKLTHAVKEPLLIPEMISLSSTAADPRQYENITLNWLTRKEYQAYKTGRNIIMQRANADSNNLSIPIGSSLARLKLEMHVERLDATEKGQRFLNNVTPTGNLELWMRKEEYVDNPASIGQAPDKPVSSFADSDNSFALEYKIPFSNDVLNQLKQLNNIQFEGKDSDLFRDIISTLQLQFDIKTTKFELREYYLKDISKFKGFFTADPLLPDNKTGSLEKMEEYVLPKLAQVTDKDSLLRFKVMVLNNAKPSKPEIAFAVTTIREDRSYHGRRRSEVSQRGNIITVYLKRGRLSSGKDERVGIIINDPDNTKGEYNAIFKKKDWFSKAGRDILSDQYSPQNQLLKYGDIIIPNDYDAEYDPILGIYHFLPQFDPEKQLWKFEVELNITAVGGKQLHNPFINLSLVHYQPFSLNYNYVVPQPGAPDLSIDCRVSDADNSTWCYLLPERKLSVYFSKPCWIFDQWGSVNLTVSFDPESLHAIQDGKNSYKIRDNFILQAEGSLDGFVWQKIESYVDNAEPAQSKYQHALLTNEAIVAHENSAHIELKFSKHGENITFRHFRIRLVEVEWFTDQTWQDMINANAGLLDIDVVNNEDLRVRFVELIY